jgi:hypothetical protein
MVAMMHDYRIMNPHKGFLCLNELVLGVGLRPPMCSVFREKVGAATFRRMILEAVRFKVSSCFAYVFKSLHAVWDTGWWNSNPNPNHLIITATDTSHQALDALEEGLVDSLGELDDALKFVDDLGLVAKAQPGMSGKLVYSDLKREMYRETVELLENGNEEEAREAAMAEKVQREDAAREKNVASATWQKAKLWCEGSVV